MCPFRAEHYDHVHEDNDDVHADNTDNKWGDHRHLNVSIQRSTMMMSKRGKGCGHREELIEDNSDKDDILGRSFGSGTYFSGKTGKQHEQSPTS